MKTLNERLIERDLKNLKRNKEFDHLAYCRCSKRVFKYSGSKFNQYINQLLMIRINMENRK